MGEEKSTPDVPTGPMPQSSTNNESALISRMYDYMLGGTINSEVDRNASRRAAAAAPGSIEGARCGIRANRDFLGRAVRHMMAEGGVRQFLDIGSGIPSDDNTHGIARIVAPEARVVYVDKDPMVLANAYELLRSAPRASTAYLQQDIRDPGRILERAAATLDFSEPIGLMVVGMLHFLPDDDDPYQLVAKLLDPMPSGSYLAVSHLTDETRPEVTGPAVDLANEVSEGSLNVRSKAEFSRFLDNLELVEPGVVVAPRWRPRRNSPPPTGPMLDFYVAVGRKP